MTEIAMRADQGALVPDQPNPGIDLKVWAEQAMAAAQLAERICSTSLVPKAYFGKPAEATAAMLAGAELGFNPMASLRAFDNINGTPQPKAMTLRAVVLAAGHECVIVESTDARAVVKGRRRGDTEWQTSTWDIPRAEKLANYKSNPNYRTNPGQMLAARATAEVCRWVGADAIMGMPYAAEEMDDHPAPAPAVRRLTVADLDETPAVEAPAGPITDHQRKRMFALWRELGFDGDANREQRLAITAKILRVDELESSSDLTEPEADEVIAALIERRERMRTEGGAE
jgi:hypothetical protein